MLELAPDFMHEFELGVWKTLFTHLIRLLWATTPDGSSVLKFNDRFRQMPPFGTDTIRRFKADTSEMKKLAARDFEDILQCCIPVFDGLLPDKDENRQLLKLLYRTAELHAFAKMRCHTDNTIEHLTEVTVAFGRLIRLFKEGVCKNLGDYPAYTRMFGPSDGYSTQVGELAHRLVKRLYGLTNKRKVANQIGKRVERLERARLARELRLKHEKRRHVVHRVSGRSIQKSAAVTDGGSDDAVETVPSNTTSPKNFLPKLQDHLLGRKMGRTFDGDNHDEFTDEDRNSFRIYGDKIYQVGSSRFHFTTYDNRRDFDVVTPTSRPDVIVASQEANRRRVPFWHARVMGVYHVKVSTTHSKVPLRDRGIERMPFLFVRWMGAEPGYRFGFGNATLPKVGFVEHSDDFDNFAFGFLDPSQVIRGCHLIPDFESGRTSKLLPYPCEIARQMDDNPNDDWANYYVNIFADRDMVMRYYGGGIGHVDQIPEEDRVGADNEARQSPQEEDEVEPAPEVESTPGTAAPDSGSSRIEEDEENLEEEPFLDDDDSASTDGIRGTTPDPPVDPTENALWKSSTARISGATGTSVAQRSGDDARIDASRFLPSQYWLTMGREGERKQENGRKIQRYSTTKTPRTQTVAGIVFDSAMTHRKRVTIPTLVGGDRGKFPVLEVILEDAADIYECSVTLIDEENRTEHEFVVASQVGEGLRHSRAIQEELGGRRWNGSESDLILSTFHEKIYA
ncbi:hypothetical protein NMY22_g14524 [Coprinellus aureogranulatus]|nr:hypothetical protein NMY22_g14524 [Coprinellus aureogranulatus]